MKRTTFFATLAVCGGIAFGADHDTVLSADGLGAIQIGLPVDRLERVIGAKLTYNPYVNHGCSVVTTPQLEPRGISFMIEGKRLTRINIDFYATDPRPLEIRTDSGVGLGSAEDEVAKAYGSRLRVKPNPADPTWHTLVVDNTDHSRAIIFETDGKKVKSIRTGEYPSIVNQVACS